MPDSNLGLRQGSMLTTCGAYLAMVLGLAGIYLTFVLSAVWG
ncbi:hypothetical protein [Arthrobacter sp. HMWF013]|nr:hypothetical protein [Arthrobacter sp. HMWF013]